MNNSSLKSHKNDCNIAVIGLGCNYPGAKSPLQLWENILARRQQFRKMPDVRLPSDEYYDPDPSVLNKTYQNKAAVIDGYQFNWLDKRIPKQTYESTDIVHWLALDTALQAIADANYNKDSIPKEKSGVILGNTLTGEFTRSNQMLLRWPYVRKALRASAKQKGLTHLIEELEDAMEKYYKSVFAPVTEDTLAGGLANTIAGRICNYLDIHGGGYIVDGACSSSILAIDTAANYLELGQMDVVIAGGVDISLDTFELVGFAKTGALTSDEMRVYDKAGKGFLPGEGCGMVVLKRLEDALRDKDQVYATLNGWGISSDGKGGITAPSASGQSKALIRAYEKAKFDPVRLDFVEGHGTGTTVGDKVELEGINIALNNNQVIPQRNCGVTSFKSIVGHTKAAAGVGAFIKTVIAVNRRILPPTAGLKEFNAIFEDKAKSLYPISHGQVRDPKSTLFAGVSAMGFGGINSHVLLQSGDAPSQKLQPGIEENKLMVSNQSHELYLFSAATRDDLIEVLQKTIKDAAGMSYAEMADLACMHNNKVDFSEPVRAAIVANTPFDLERKLNVLIDKVKEWANDRQISFENNTIAVGYKLDNLRIGALYPGQGSQKLNMTYRLIERHDWLKEIVQKAGEIFASAGTNNVISSIFKATDRATDGQQIITWQNELKQTNIAQPAITLTSLVLHNYLERLGIKINCVSGHSLGELMAFYAAGLLSEEALLKFAAFRGQSMAEFGSGTMASLVCSRSQAEKYISQTTGYVTVANINAPEQTVISGEADSINQIIHQAENDHIGAVILPVSAAFHSNLVAEVAKAIGEYALLKTKNPKNKKICLISSTDGKQVEETVDLNAYFSFQALNKVDFISTVHALQKHCDILLEIGPGKVLSGLVSNISSDIKAFPVEINAEDDMSLNVLLGNAFVWGSNINVSELYKERLIRDFVPAYNMTFLINPLELPFPKNISQEETEPSLKLNALFGLDIKEVGFSRYLKIRSNFIKDVIDTDFKYFLNNDWEQKPVTGTISSIVHQSDIKLVKNEESDIRSILFRKIETMTGFASDGFKDDMKLLDDFNLDSIKSGALLADLAKSLNITGKISTSELSNASIGEIISKVDAITVKLSPVADLISDDANKQTGASSVSHTVYDMLSKRTGFPVDALKPGYKLLDDLNLDSIKAGAFIAELLKNFKIQGKIGITSMANAKIEDIINAVTDLISVDTPPKQLTVAEENVTSWVNAYSVKLVEEFLTVEKQLITDFWQHKSIVLVHGEGEENYAADLNQYLKLSVSKVIAVESKNLHLLNSFENSCLLILITQDPLNVNSLSKVVALLSVVAKNIGDANSLGFIQFNNGRFLKETSAKDSFEAKFSVVSFAASLHHERPDMKIRAIEVEKRLSNKQITDIVLKEFTTDHSFEAAGFDLRLTRRKMKYDLAPAITLGKGNVTFNEEDVLIATGGAKGITAECVIFFAKKYRCKTALVGSSPVNDEISGTLNRYEKENLVVRYYSCDISDAIAVKEITERIQHDLGNITIVVHGAGKNVPRRAEHVSFEEALDEISPKILGGMNLSDALRDNNLKCFIAFTSIIGITGMPGNSWYAFSNENLDLFLREIGKRHRCRVRTVAYSVWDEVGMGARMGSNKVLAKMGIGSISPALGIEQFLRWVEFNTNDQQVVVSSSMGGLDTWNLIKPELPEEKRYISAIRHFEPGRELITRVKLSRSTDLYLDDHNYNGSLLFPTVLGLEAMAQAAYLLSGVKSINSMTFENISLLKPIIIPDTGETEIEIKATVIEGVVKSLEPIRIYIGISTEHTGFTSFNFSTEIILNEKFEPERKDVKLPSVPLKISPKTDLYTWLLFQGPRFQHIKKVYGLNSNKVEFMSDAIENDPSDDCFAESCKAPLLLGSPLFRDILLQSVQLFLTGKKYLPITIRRWELYDIKKQSGGGIVISTLKNLDEDKGECDVEFIVNNQVIEKIEGYTVKALEPTPDYPEPYMLADLQSIYTKAIDNEFSKYQDLLDHKIDYSIYKHDEEFNYLDRKTRRIIEESVFQTMLPELQNNSEGLENKIIWAANGKPAIGNSKLKISISHSRSVLLMTVGLHEQGCDIEFIENKTEGEWNDLLDNKYSNVLEQLKGIDNDINISATRIWCLKEALIKSLGKMPLGISIEKAYKNGVVFKVKTSGRHNMMVLTFPVSILPNTVVMISSIIVPKEVEKTAITFQDEGRDSASYFNKSIGGFSHNFLTTFKDCKAFFGKTHFTDFPGWMGTLRELVLAPIGTELLNDLGSGQFGMVTNASDVHILNEADTLSQITGNLWITNKSDLENSFIDLKFEFIRKQPETGTLIRLAKCNLSTTWVKIESRGIVKKSPIPDYFMAFLNKYLLKSEMTDQFENSISYPGIRDLGKPAYERRVMIRPQILLLEKVFQTGISNGNTVGNLYYSNYYDWQSVIIEQYLFKLAPEIMLDNGRSGEFLTLESNVKHLQEAMPFETISMYMYIEKIYENGLKFYFEYFSQLGEEKRKLAYGSNTVIWSKRLYEKSTPIVQRLPEKITNAILSVTVV
jgi:enediyne polyketide synthase